MIAARERFTDSTSSTSSPLYRPGAGTNASRNNSGLDWYSGGRFPLVLKGLDAHHHLRMPLTLAVEFSPDGYVVSDPLVNRFGDGDTLEDAVEHYVESVLTYMSTLQRNRDRLAHRPALHLHLLEQLIEEA
jgi:hypothetical protein